jgi:hypothetical protein
MASLVLDTSHVSSLYFAKLCLNTLDSCTFAARQSQGPKKGLPRSLPLKELDFAFTFFTNGNKKRPGSS